MVGVRKFDEQQVLAQALEVFWRKGFPSTSMLDLAQAAGVQRGSLYNAYGDKEELFMRAFEGYAARFLDEVRNALDARDAKQALQRFFGVAIANMTSGFPPRGCLTTKAATDGSIHSLRIHQRVQRILEDLEVIVRMAMSREPMRAGLALEPPDAAKVIVTFTRGLAVMERVHQDPKWLKQAAAALVRILLVEKQPGSPPSRGYGGRTKGTS